MLRVERGDSNIQMRVPRVKLKAIIVLLSFLLILPISHSSAQPGGPKPAPGAGMRPWKGEHRCGRASDLNLSSDQIKGLDLANRTYLQETMTLRTDLFSKRLELRELLTTPSIKIETIQQKNGEIIELQAKLEEKAVDYLIKVRSFLTQEQLKNWCPEQEFHFLRGRIHGPDVPGPMMRRAVPFGE